MLAKLTSKNQLTLPQAVASAFQGTKYFDITNENGRIVLTPVRPKRAAAVRRKLADLACPRPTWPKPWPGHAKAKCPHPRSQG